MKSDLTCPVEIVAAEVRAAETTGDARGTMLCVIQFQNLVEREINSLQMNIICFDANDERLGGRLVRASVHGEEKCPFTGTFILERAEAVQRVEASVEKVWYIDGLVWRREERNVREYTPNWLPEGRDLDRLRGLAGPDARGYAREDDSVWLCVCGHANRTSEDVCMRCGRERAFVMQTYSFEAIDLTLGAKEREREQATRESIRKSGEQSAREAEQAQKKKKRRSRRFRAIVAVLSFVAFGLAAYRWLIPWGAAKFADRQLSQGKAADAKSLYDWVSERWPNAFQAEEKSREAETVIIERLIAERTETALRQAVERAEVLGDAALQRRASLVLADWYEEAGEAEKEEALLRAMAGDQEAEEKLCALVYRLAEAAQKKLDYAQAVERFTSLGAYQDAKERMEESLYLWGRQLLREEKFAEAGARLEQIPAYEDALILLRQARYRLAEQQEAAGLFVEAAQLYESLGFYEDAPTRSLASRYAAGEAAEAAGDHELAAEQFLLAEDHEDATERFAVTARALTDEAIEAKDWQTAIGWLTQLRRDADVQEALDRSVYAWALQLLGEGRREEAALEFATLGEYQDAQERANEIEYALAREEADRAPDEALARFEALGTYKDAQQQAEACRWALIDGLEGEGRYEEALDMLETVQADQRAANEINRCRYALAAKRYADGDYVQAAALYAQCGAYLDAEEGILKAKYAAAGALESDGRYQEAAMAFDALGSYADAKQAKERCEDEWLRDRWLEAAMDADLGNYSGVIEALEPVWQETLPSRYAEISAMYEAACLGMAQELIGLSRPLDALPYLEKIPDNKTAKRRLSDYVYQIIGRWKETRGTEFIFRRDGTCSIAGQEGYFGGSGYEIFIGDTPYPTKPAYSVVSIRRNTLTVKEKQSGKTLRLSYLGEPAPAETEEISSETDEASVLNDRQDADSDSETLIVFAPERTGEAP